MKSAPFAYHAPDTVDEALALLAPGNGCACSRAARASCS